jgi:molybdopterin converting factor small subunit
MSITIQIPTALRPDCGGASELSLSAATVRAALDQIEQSHPALFRSVCDETGAVRRHVNLFVNDSFLNRLEGLNTALQPGDILTIMPAVSGG